MKRDERARLARMTLDHRFTHGGLDALSERPARGWIRAIRDALGMTSRQLANRMDISQPAVVQLERSEIDERIRLDSLRRAADAMDCDLVYAFVPRTSLETIVESHARQIALREIIELDAALSVGDQPTGDLKRRTDEHMRQLISEGRIWDEADR